HTQAPQPIQKPVAIIAEQHAGECRDAISERGEQQSAVGDALGSGDPHDCVKRPSSGGNSLSRHRLRFLSKLRGLSYHQDTKTPSFRGRDRQASCIVIQIRSYAVGRFGGLCPPKNSSFRPPVAALPPQVGEDEGFGGRRPSHPAKTPTA